MKKAPTGFLYDVEKGSADVDAMTAAFDARGIDLDAGNYSEMSVYSARSVVSVEDVMDGVSLCLFAEPVNSKNKNGRFWATVAVVTNNFSRTRRHATPEAALDAALKLATGQVRELVLRLERINAALAKTKKGRGK